MGYQSTIIIRNDALGDIESNPKQFVENLLAAIFTVADGAVNLDVPCGNHANVARVIEVHHSDATTVVSSGGSTGELLGTVQQWRWPNTEAKIRALIQVLQHKATELNLLEKKWEVNDGRQSTGKRVVEEVVVKSIARKFSGDLPQFEKTMRELVWDGLNGCYGFYYANMFHGVETDGHIHT